MNQDNKNWETELISIQSKFKSKVLSCAILDNPLKWMKIENKPANSAAISLLYTFLLATILWSLNRIINLPFSLSEIKLLLISVALIEELKKYKYINNQSKLHFNYK